MTIWVLHLRLTPEEEAHIQERTELPLPFGDVPDLSHVTNEASCYQLLQKIHPGDPPETLRRKAERLWSIYGVVAMEDVIAVPLKASGMIALAHVTGHYRHAAGPNGEDRHTIPVGWYDSVPLRRFGKHKKLFEPSGAEMTAVTRPEERTAIRDRLPHSYNRFSGWKWILVGIFGLKIIEQVIRHLHMH